MNTVSSTLITRVVDDVCYDIIKKTSLLKLDNAKRNNRSILSSVGSLVTERSVNYIFIKIPDYNIYVMLCM